MSISSLNLFEQRWFYLILLLLHLVNCGACESSSKENSTALVPLETSVKDKIAPNKRHSFYGKAIITSVFPALKFNEPVGIHAHANTPGKLWIIEKSGRILSFKKEKDGTTSELTVLLDIKKRVNDKHSEAGLLGFALHPDYPKDDRFFVYYTAGYKKQVSTLSVFKPKPATIVEERVYHETKLLELPQPYGNHNGGDLRFGPDGMLYLGLGDGGSGEDPHEHGQDTSSLFGTILRLDISGPLATTYTVPPDNPFATTPEIGRGEIFAYGLRNPWRISFDQKTGRLYAADVGQYKWEEINEIIKGGNYGWRIREGRHDFFARKKITKRRPADKLIEPIAEYGHDLGQAVTGGFVYRGSAIPELIGHYIYADFASGNVWALSVDKINTDKRSNGKLLMQVKANISSFGQDLDGELYALDYYSGQILKLLRK